MKRLVAVGETLEEITVNDRRTKQVAGKSVETRTVYEPAEAYQRTAKRLGISLETALETLPRAEMAIESVFVSEAYHTVKVRCSLTRTLSDFDARTQNAALMDMTSDVDDHVTETLGMLKERLELHE